MRVDDPQRHLHGSRGTRAPGIKFLLKSVIVCNQTLALRGVGNMELLCIIDVGEPSVGATIPTNMDGRQLTFCRGT